jgi:nitrate reductase NapAB chaperone NapD
MRAYILVDIQPGRESDILTHLATVEGIVYADVVHGAFDLVVVLEGDPETIDKTIMRIRRLPYVKKTESMLSFHPTSWEELSYELSSGTMAKSRVERT